MVEPNFKMIETSTHTQDLFAAGTYTTSSTVEWGMAEVL